MLLSFCLCDSYINVTDSTSVRVMQGRIFFVYLNPTRTPELYAILVYVSTDFFWQFHLTEDYNDRVLIFLAPHSNNATC